jgi:hypothetical protein
LGFELAGSAKPDIRDQKQLQVRVKVVLIENRSAGWIDTVTSAGAPSGVR